MSAKPEAEPFSAFMQRALYDPKRGYYTARIRTVGARGDFSTSATLSTSLGRAIAAWVSREAKAVKVHTIIEVGGGNGSLMQSVLQALGWWRRWRFRVLMVETSPILRQQQQERLNGGVRGWFGSLQEALAVCSGEALIFHNELLDAFPVDLVQWDGFAWREVWIENGREVVRDLNVAKLMPYQREPLPPYPLPFVEGESDSCVPDELVNQNAASAGSRDEGEMVQSLTPFSALRSTPARPQRCELGTALHAWVQGWLPHWRRGAMLTIDYGDEFPAVYHRRLRGTLRAYLFQQRLEGLDVYANPGRQDITCDVNFTDWRAWLQQAGLRETLFCTQSEFLGQDVSNIPTDGFVADVDGAGAAFKCHAVRRL